MHVLAIILGIIGIVLFVVSFWSSADGDHVTSGLRWVGSVAIVLAVALSFTPSAKLGFSQIGAASSASTWIVVDNSGGETLRHWVLEDRYVTSPEGSDGWTFIDATGNICYVGGDAFVIQVKHEGFLSVYKKKLNIPEDQEALK